MDASPEDIRDPSTRSSHDPWRLAPAIVFGAVGLPILIWVSDRWLRDWTDCGSGCWAPIFLSIGAAGLCFGYLAGLVWRWPSGLVGPAIGILIGPLTIGTALTTLGRDDLTGTILPYSVIAAIVGIVAYPIGLLARRALGREPLLGLLVGAPLVIVAGVAILTATPPPYDYASAPTGTVLAPSMLFAGIGTLVVVFWSLLLRA